MKEIADHIYVETSFPGVTLGAISWQHGLIMIDTPFRMEDARSWRSALVNFSMGGDRLLVLLDANYDRTMGVRFFESTVVGHERLASAFRSRPVNPKAQGSENGAEWELNGNLPNVRWIPPDIEVSEDLSIHWDDSPLVLQARPGSSNNALWATLPGEGVVFVGDAVLINQPPFLDNADIPLWVESLEALLQPPIEDYLVVSGRGGLVAAEQISEQIAFLRRAENELGELAAANEPVNKVETLVEPLLGELSFPPERKALYTKRLRWGMMQYYQKRFHPAEAKGKAGARKA